MPIFISLIRFKVSFVFYPYVQLLVEKENERRTLLEELLQTKEALISTRQKVELLHQEVKKLQEREQVGMMYRNE